MKILMGFAEAVPAAEAIFSLREAGHEIRVFARAGAATPVVPRLAPDRPVYIQAPEADTAAAKAALLDALRADPPDALYAIDDPSLWLVNAIASDIPEGIHVINAMGSQAEIALDKRTQIAAADAAGLAVPETLIATKAAEIGTFTTLPAISKPAMATAEVDGALDKGGAAYFLTEAERDALAANDSELSFPALVQPLIHGTGIGVFGFACETGEIVNWSGHERVRMMNPHGSGSSACRSRMPDAPTRAAITRMMADIGWRGPFMVELLEDDAGTLWFMEINGRLWGSLALARRTGFEYPAWAVAQTLDPSFLPPEVTPPARPVVMRHLGRDILHLLAMVKGPKSEFHKARWPRFLTSLRGVLTPHSRRWYYNYDAAAPGFYRTEAFAVVRAKLRGR